MPTRIVCIGDLHGDYQVFLRVLEMCSLINTAGNWVGGSTTLVQMGDTLDGKRPGVNISKEFIKIPGELQIFEKIIKLNAQAKPVNGKVISLLGNHELYPHYYGNDKEFIKDYVKVADANYFKQVYKMDRVNLLKPGGKIAKSVLSTRPIIHKIGKFLFVHGSITDDLIKYGLENGKVNIDKINKGVSKWMKTGRNLPQFLNDMESQNPAFSRFYSKPKEKRFRKTNEQLKKFEGVEYVVIGHTPFKQINIEHKVIRTDVALSRAFGENLSTKKLQALEILNPHGSPKLNVITTQGSISLLS